MGLSYSKFSYVEVYRQIQFWICFTAQLRIGVKLNFGWHIHRGSYMSAHVLWNLLNELSKRDKM